MFDPGIIPAVEDREAKKTKDSLNYMDGHTRIITKTNQEKETFKTKVTLSPS